MNVYVVCITIIIAAAVLGGLACLIGYIRGKKRR